MQKTRHFLASTGTALVTAFALIALTLTLAAPADAQQRTRVEGTLTDEGVECPALRADDGTLYTLLGDLEGFGVGDEVVVVGSEVAISFCQQGTTLQVEQIFEARSNDPRVLVIEGTLTDEGVECQAFRAADGSLFTLVGDLEDLETGDRARIVGSRVDISFCQQGTTLEVLQAIELR